MPSIPETPGPAPERQAAAAAIFYGSLLFFGFLWMLFRKNFATITTLDDFYRK
jgi:hypothetical protein